MCADVYGINDKEKLTALEVRDALNECFFEAHCEDADLTDDQNVDKMYCESIVKKAFESTGGDYDEPTKDSIMAAMGYLQEFSKNFRDPKIVEKHAADIMKLLEKLS